MLVGMQGFGLGMWKIHEGGSAGVTTKGTKYTKGGRADEDGGYVGKAGENH